MSMNMFGFVGGLGPQGQNRHFVYSSFVPSRTNRYSSLLLGKPPNRDMQCGGTFMHENHRALSDGFTQEHQRPMFKKHDPWCKWRAAYDSQKLPFFRDEESHALQVAVSALQRLRRIFLYRTVPIWNFREP